MVSSCCAFGCKKRWKKDSSISFHTFPLKKPEELKIWIKAVGKKDFKPKASHHLCSEHFTEKDFVVRPGAERRMLRHGAVPFIISVNLPKINQKIAPTKSCLQEIQEICPPKPITTEDPLSHSPAPKTPKKSRTQMSIRCLRQKLRRRNLKIKTLKELIRSLKSNGLVDGNVLHMFEDQFSGKLAAHLFHNVLKNQKRNPRARRYSEDVNKFAIALYKNSPKAYRFCRKILHLPLPSRLVSNWTSSFEVEPGFLKNVFQKLQTLTDDKKDCNLVLGSMSIRKQIIWDPLAQKFLGFCDFGDSLASTWVPDHDDEPATEVLFFMLVGLKHEWNWPIGYFLQNKYNANIQSNLIKSALQLSKNVGLRVHGITFDGTATNFATAQVLGCNVLGSYDVLKSNFTFEVDDYYVIPDVCHMIKLARNCLASQGKLKSPNGTIEWRYITNLYDFQSSMGLKIANKLTKNHIDWVKNKTNSKFAIETLSSSIAGALEYLKDQGLAEFNGAEETIKFIKNFDKLFDMLNSSTPSTKSYKTPFLASNINFIEEEASKIIDYMFKLKNYYTNEDLFLTREKTFLIGFALAVNSIVNISKKLLLASGKFKLVLAYKFSKNHLELFFSKIRPKNDALNNNPNVGELKASLKNTLLRKGIVSYADICKPFKDDPLPSGNILEIKSKTKQTVSVEITVQEGNAENFNIIYNIKEDEHIQQTDLSTDYYEAANTITQTNILSYISSVIVKKILREIDCITCRRSLIREPEEHNYAHLDILQTSNDLAGIVDVSENCLRIVKEAEKNLAVNTNGFTILSGVNVKFMDRIIMKVVNVLLREGSFFDLCDKVEKNLRYHTIELIKLVTKYYLDERLFALGEQRTENMNISKRHNL